MTNEIVVSGNGNLKKGYNVVMARGQGSLDISDSKTFNYLLQRSYTQLNKRSIHQIPVSDLLSFLSHTSISRVEKTLQNLSNVTIEIDYTDYETGEQHSVKTHFLSYDVSKAQDGILTYAFDPILLKFLWEPKIYTQINLQFTQNFKSQYGFKLFEIMSFFPQRFNRAWTPSIKEFRERIGIDENQYTRFDNLKRAVIDKAVEEINQYAHFYLHTSLIRGGKGGKVVAIKFEIVDRPDELILPSNTPVSGKKSKNRDPYTIDFVDGKTDNERGNNLIISSEAIADAEKLITENDIPVDELVKYEDEWRQAVNDVKVTDPDLNFLRWLNIQIDKRINNTLPDLDDDIFGDILAGFE